MGLRVVEPPTTYGEKSSNPLKKKNTTQQNSVPNNIDDSDIGLDYCILTPKTTAHPSNIV